MAVLTIYNCGTCSDRNAKDAVPILYRATIGQGDTATITDGVGSTAKMKDGGKKSWHENKATGIAFGVGVDSNVDYAVDFVEQKIKQTRGAIDLVNMCGWSRGGVTCFKIANKLYHKGSFAAKQVPVRIFAIDPVPGSAGAFNNHMYNNIDLNPNVKECTIILAETEKRGLFQPVLDPIFFDSDKPTTYLWYKMPGNHSGVLTENPEHGDAAVIVRDMAKRFLYQPHPSLGLPSPATRFGNEAFLTDDEILTRYSKVMLEFDAYVKMGEGFLNFLQGGGFGNTRTVLSKSAPKAFMDKNKWQGIGLFRPKAAKSSRFFVNAHHANMFESRYQLVFSALRHPEKGQGGAMLNMLNPNNSVGRQFVQLLSHATKSMPQVAEHLSKFITMNGGSLDAELVAAVYRAR